MQTVFLLSRTSRSYLAQQHHGCPVTRLVEPVLEQAALAGFMAQYAYARERIRYLGAGEKGDSAKLGSYHLGVEGRSGSRQGGIRLYVECIINRDCPVLWCA